ncbi:hypothetical protein EJB05_04599, partial [Eragrostis curvula]
RPSICSRSFLLTGSCSTRQKLEDQSSRVPAAVQSVRFTAEGCRRSWNNDEGTWKDAEEEYFGALRSVKATCPTWNEVLRMQKRTRVLCNFIPSSSPCLRGRHAITRRQRHGSASEQQ